MSSQPIQLIASGITSLDEARYFAAMGADWLGFDTATLDTEAIKTMRDWVIGPRIFVELHPIDDETLFRMIDISKPDGICMPLESEVIPSWFTGTTICSYSSLDPYSIASNKACGIILIDTPITNANIEQLQDICLKHPCWITLKAGVTDMEWLLKTFALKGLVIRCDQNEGLEYPFEYYDNLLAQFELAKGFVS